jgi:hypothetical protein
VTCSRLPEEGQLFGSISLKGYYIRRACRTLPTAFTYLLVLLLLAMGTVVVVTPLEWWTCILFFRNYLPPEWVRGGRGGYTIHQLVAGNRGALLSLVAGEPGDELGRAALLQPLPLAGVVSDSWSELPVLVAATVPN